MTHPLPPSLVPLFQPYDPAVRSAPQSRKVSSTVRQRRRRRADLYVAGKSRCGICGRRIKSLMQATIDHVVPKAEGGKTDGNTVAAHKHCNAAKGNRMPTGCERIWLLLVNARLSGIATSATD